MRKFAGSRFSGKDMIAWYRIPRNQLLVQTWRFIDGVKCLIDSEIRPTCPTCKGTLTNHVRGCNSRGNRREYSGA
jgi:hypothetical protein